MWETKTNTETTSPHNYLIMIMRIGPYNLMLLKIEVLPFKKKPIWYLLNWLIKIMLKMGLKSICVGQVHLCKQNIYKVHTNKTKISMLFKSRTLISYYR